MQKRLLSACLLLASLLASKPAAPAAPSGGSFMEMVKVSTNLSVGKYEVTQAQYEAVMGRNPSQFKGPRKPVENVSWEEAMKFCKKLTEQERAAGRLPPGMVYSLPTEKQWESYAAGTSLDTAVTSQHQNRTSTENVGSMRPNRLGLYDVRGNVWEWCLNTEDADSDARIIRGGGFSNADAEKLALSYRFALTPLFKVPGIGFRCVLVPGK